MDTFKRNKYLVLVALVIFILVTSKSALTRAIFNDTESAHDVSITTDIWAPTPSEKITICHVAGRRDEPANYITLEIPPQALNGHFYENGTPKAGHEEDYLGPCNSPEAQVAGVSTVLPTIKPTESPTPIPESPSPIPTETLTPEPTPTPGI